MKPDRRTEAVSAIATGLVMAALPVVLDLGPLATVVDLLILLVLGSFLRSAPWRAGVLASLPVVGTALLLAATEGLGFFLLVVLISPLIILVFGRVARAGSTLLGPARREEQPPTRELRSQRRRGRFLLCLGTTGVVFAWTASWWASSEVDNRAERAAITMERLLEETTVPEILLSPASVELPEGVRLRAIAKESDGAKVVGEVRTLWQVRCVVGHLDAAGDAKVVIESCSLP